MNVPVDERGGRSLATGAGLSGAESLSYQQAFLRYLEIDPLSPTKRNCGKWQRNWI